MKQIRPAVQCQQLENAASEIMEASITAVVCHYWSYGKTSSMIRKNNTYMNHLFWIILQGIF